MQRRRLSSAVTALSSIRVAGSVGEQGMVECAPGDDATEETKDTRIVVMDISGQQIGMIVDEVTEVLRIPADSVEPPSSIITSAAESSYLLGIAKLEDRMITLLDMDKALSVEHTAGFGEMRVTLEDETDRETEVYEEEDEVEEVEEIASKTPKPSKPKKTKSKTLAKATK